MPEQEAVEAPVEPVAEPAVAEPSPELVAAQQQRQTAEARAEAAES